jgi:hypothetical protein
MEAFFAPGIDGRILDRSHSEISKVHYEKHLMTVGREEIPLKTSDAGPALFQRISDRFHIQTRL